MAKVKFNVSCLAHSSRCVCAAIILIKILKSEIEFNITQIMREAFGGLKLMLRKYQHVRVNMICQICNNSFND